MLSLNIFTYPLQLPRSLLGVDRQHHQSPRCTVGRVTLSEGLDEALNALLFVFVLVLHVVLINSRCFGGPGGHHRRFGAAGGWRGRWRSRRLREDLGRLCGPYQVANMGRAAGWAVPLAVSLPEAPWKPSSVTTTFVVVFSIVLQGLTIGRIFDRPQLENMLRCRHPEGGLSTLKRRDVRAAFEPRRASGRQRADRRKFFILLVVGKSDHATDGKPVPGRASAKQARRHEP